MSLIIPAGYVQELNARKTNKAILKIKADFQRRLWENLNLTRASAPPYLKAGTGFNDDLNGTERKVAFVVKETGEAMEVPNSLAKWKRWALAAYGFGPGEGIWTDMNAMRPDEEQDNLHSIYVDQWDWERVILPAERTEDFLKSIVHKIFGAIKKTEMMVYDEYDIQHVLPEDISFITTSELEERFPSASRKERENLIAQERRAVFIMQIGWPLKDGKPHDGRAPDYDDWNLNGDIIVWNPVLQAAFELSSMGIRVDKESLVKQLEHANATERLQLDFHRMLMNDELPLSIGGGIGQSRLCMFLLRKAHIGEVHSSQAWPRQMIGELARNGVKLL